MNPLLEAGDFPAFDRIRAEHLVPALEQALDEARSEIDTLAAGGGPHTWESLLMPLERMQERLHKLWSPAGHLNAVVNSPQLRDAYNACLPQLSAFYTEIGQHRGLYEAIEAFAQSAQFQALDTAQRKSVHNRLRDFRLSGIALEDAARERFKAIQQRLSVLQSTFQDNVLDATNAWRKPIRDDALLSGLPETARQLARQTAAREQLEGYVFTLEFPSYLAVMTYADERELREEFYTAFNTRASECGPHAGQWDNSAVMEEILSLRHESAQLLGYASFAELSLETKMASSPDEVIAFLEHLAERAVDKARGELEDVRAFAREQGLSDTLQAWDIPYYSEKLRQQRYALSQEELKPYFPDTRVIGGLFDVVKRLYGIEIRERTDVPVWHEDVKVFDIFEADGNACGHFYLDLYARPHKRGGAWMDDYASRMQLAGRRQLPVAYLTCNFSPGVGEQPALLTHSEVITLFHEFGHGLHHMLTRIDTPSVAGINGVAWDAVELPSQFMENWCWENQALAVISGHYESGEPLPETVLQRLQAARNFQSAMQMVRQLEFALFDMRIHREYDPAKGARIADILQGVRDQVAVVPAPAFNRFAHGFSHVFGGGYAAGYYSYKWAEVLSADAFSLFEEQGVFDAASGRRFRDHVLAMGGAKDAMALYVAYRGREPDINALLRHCGLGQSEEVADPQPV